MSNSTCNYPQCTKTARVRGWCSAHYERWRKYGDPSIVMPRVDPPRHPPQADECQADGCSADPWAKSFCGKHYRAWRLYGDPLASARRRRTFCSRVGCDRPTHGNGLCTMHYLRVRATGTAELITRRSVICTEIGCSTATTLHRTVCERHYFENRRYGGPSKNACLDCGQNVSRGRKRCATCALAERYRTSKDLGHARRVSIRGSHVEKVDTRLVFERDGWCCQLCYEPVDRALAWPHPKSRSLDHIVSLSNGGEHTYANTQLAHLRCNTAKGNRDAG